jgi:hypothetical protein
MPSCQFSMLMEGTLHSVNGSAETRLSTDALSSTLQHVMHFRMYLRCVCTSWDQVLPRACLGGSRALPPLTKGGARGLECNALITLHEKS